MTEDKKPDTPVPKLDQKLYKLFDAHESRAAKRFAKHLDKKPVGARLELYDGSPMGSELHPMNNLFGFCNYHQVLLSHGWLQIESYQSEVNRIGIPKSIIQVDVYKKMEQRPAQADGEQGKDLGGGA